MLLPSRNSIKCREEFFSSQPTWYARMVMTYGKSMDQPGKIANPARGQQNRQHEYSPVSVRAMRIWSCETGSACPSRVSLLISILRLNLVLTFYGIPPDFRGGVHLFIQTVIRHWVSSEFIGSRSCVPMTLTAERPPAQGQ